jgi:hypothetical protein
LASGFPEIRVETIQFARSNYKGHGEEHFPKVTGLMVEQNFYSPFNVCSSVLRYWHLVESLFEPAVSSVHLFTENGLGQVEGNCGDITFGAIDPSVPSPTTTLAIPAIVQSNSPRRPEKSLASLWRARRSA